jgi:hypothetical protein
MVVMGIFPVIIFPAVTIPALDTTDKARLGGQIADLYTVIYNCEIVDR